MHPELIENPTFLRYYEKWQRDPTSVVFTAISEIFRSYGLIDDAIKIATEGLKHHPGLVSGHVALSKAYFAKGEKISARDHAMIVLERMPGNADAKQILESLNIIRQESVIVPPASDAAPLEPEAPKLVLNSDAFDDEEITEDMPLASIKIKDDAEIDEGMERYAQSQTAREEKTSVSDHEAWYTVTMARILAGQGDTERAKKIYKAILGVDPGNEEARKGLDGL